MRIGGLTLTDDEQRFGAANLGLEGRPHGSGGHGEAIADTDRGIDCYQRQIKSERRVLEPVVHDDDVDVFIHKAASTGGAITRDDGGRDGRKQERLVTDFDRGVDRWIDKDRRLRGAAVPGGQQAGLEPPAPRHAGERDGCRGLAGAANDEIADANHSHRGAIGRRLCHAPRGGAAPHPSDRTKHIGRT
jgi:hypothetical protein